MGAIVNDDTAVRGTLALLPELVEAASGRWRVFDRALAPKSEVALCERIMLFAHAAMQGIRSNYRELRTAPDGVLMLVVALAVLKSGTHTRTEVEAALGVDLPRDAEDIIATLRGK